MSRSKYNRMSNSERIQEDWMNRRWRPAMGWMYMAVCITDFILFPIMWSVFKAHVGEKVDPWEPLTLQGAGLFHLAMGAILGIAAYGRTQEKLNGASTTTSNVSYYSPQTYNNQPYGNQMPYAGNFGPTPVMTGPSGRPGPVMPPDPVL